MRHKLATPASRALAVDVTQVVLNNLNDRRGFKHLLEEISFDQEVWSEMIESLHDDIENMMINKINNSGQSSQT